MDGKRANLISYGEYSHFKTIILNEIEALGGKIHLGRQQKDFTKFKDIQHDPKFLNFLYCLFTNTPRTLLDIQLLSYYLSNLDGVISIINSSESNPSELLNEISSEIYYEKQEKYRILFRKGVLFS